MTAVVIAVGSGSSVPVLRSVESVLRQTVPTTIALALSKTAPAVADSIVSRAHAAAFHARSDVAAINLAVDRCETESVAFLRIPWRFEPVLIEQCVAALHDRPSGSIAVPALRVRSTEGAPLRTIAGPLTLPALLATPFATAPVFVMRRRVWDIVGPLDESFATLAAAEWWLRVLAAGVQTVRIDDPLGYLTAGSGEWWPPILDEVFDGDRFRAMLEKHRALLERDVQPLVVEQEVSFAQLTNAHREEMRERDRRLEELEQLRARAAHHRAYLEHHGQLALEWGDLRRADPLSRNWGYDRGTPVDRYYIHDFLAACSSDVAGVVLEVQESDLTRRFGGSRVTRSEVVDIDDRNPCATLVTDLRDAAGVAGGQFDCIVLTQTLHVIDDMRAALGECYRLLKPGGVLLATLPCSSRVCLEYGPDGDLWRLTTAGAHALFEPVFGAANVATATYGNVLTNLAFQHGLACEELTDGDFAAHDPYHPLLVGVRARKPSAGARHPGARSARGVVLLYHRIDDVHDVHDLAIPPSMFAEQLSWLSRNCRVVPLEHLLRDTGDGLPERSVAISFDDGYLDTLQCAAPLLEREGLTATVFATTRWLDEPGEYWWDILERALLRQDTPSQLQVESGDPAMFFSLETSEERRNAHDTLHKYLVHASLERRDRVVSQIAAWAALPAEAHRRPLVADELRRLASLPGLTIGAHSVNHLALPDQSAAVQQRELVDCARDLERTLGTRVSTFAFPYGAVDRRSAEASRHHYQWSMTCDPAPVNTCFDTARVPRFEVKPWNSAALASHLERLFSH